MGAASLVEGQEGADELTRRLLHGLEEQEVWVWVPRRGADDEERWSYVDSNAQLTAPWSAARNRAV